MLPAEPQVAPNNDLALAMPDPGAVTQRGRRIEPYRPVTAKALTALPLQSSADETYTGRENVPPVAKGAAGNCLRPAGGCVLYTMLDIKYCI